MNQMHNDVMWTACALDFAHPTKLAPCLFAFLTDRG